MSTGNFGPSLISLYIKLAEPAGLAPHSNVYLSVPGGGSFLTKLFFPLMGVVVVWSEQEKWGCLFFAILGVVGGPWGPWGGQRSQEGKNWRGRDAVYFVLYYLLHRTIAVGAAPVWSIYL